MLQRKPLLKGLWNMTPMPVATIMNITAVTAAMTTVPSITAMETEKS
jgi:hypothetical protein